jgi:hypothetical protein
VYQTVNKESYVDETLFAKKSTGSCFQLLYFINLVVLEKDINFSKALPWLAQSHADHLEICRNKHGNLQIIVNFNFTFYRTTDYRAMDI